LREIAEIGMTEDDKEVKTEVLVALAKEKKPRAKKPAA
jgi:hypothetical protein